MKLSFLPGELYLSEKYGVFVTERTGGSQQAAASLGRGST
jgi:hypothetical protein